MRHINNYGLSKLKQWEGLRLNAYQDSGGVWTIGYGHTSNAGSPKVIKGMSLQEKEAENILKKDLEKFEKRVLSLVQVPLSDNQFSTLVSFDFNTGKLHQSTLLKKLNKGDYNAVPQELMKWVYVKGKKNKGLVNRRSAECGLWAKGSFVSSNHFQADVEEQKMSKAKDVQGASVAGAAAIAATFTETASQVAPHLGLLPSLKYVFLGLTIAGIFFSLYVSVLRIKNNNA